MSEPRGHRLRVSLTGGLTDRARAALRHGLGLDASEIRQIEKRTSFEVDLRPLGEEQRERLAESFGGVSASFTESQVNHAPCSKHPRLAESEICPDCERRTCGACRVSREGLCPACTARLSRKRLFRNLRVALLMLALLAVSLGAWRDHRAITSWDEPILVALHPHATDADDETAAHVANLDASRFAPVAEFLEREAARYGIDRRPLILIELAAPLSEVPPLPPAEPSTFDAILFSLKLRWWTWRLERDRHLSPANIRLFVLYHHPTPGAVLQHSIGLEQGHVGIVHAFAAEQLDARNTVVIAHELLHTAGATDKYDETGRPSFPDGYAEPERTPLHPQERTEIMAGWRMLEENQIAMAQSLEECVIGRRTAVEIGWPSTQ